MAVEKEKEIDIAGIDKKTDACILAIIDSMTWNDEHQHLLLLQSKLNSYLAFIESGEIFDAYPHAKGKFIIIQIRFSYELSESANKFLNLASEIIQQAGFLLVWKTEDEKEKSRKNGGCDGN